MKKIIFALALVLTIGLCADAQRRGDGFFNDWNDVSNGLDKFDDFDNGLRGGGPGLPGQGGGGGDTPAPLGSGLLVLTALGAGYAVAKRKREK